MSSRWSVLLLVGVLGCQAKPRPAPSNVAAPPQDTPDAAVEVTACERYATLSGKVEDCPALSDEIRQNIAQRSIDMLATISESGMDDSTPVDREQLCEEEVTYLERVAGTPCDL